MKALILEGDDARLTTSYDDVTAAFEAGKRFWIELDEKNEQSDALLKLLDVHPLAQEDVWADLGLPKIEDFGEYLQLVMHGIREADAKAHDVPLVLAEIDILIGGEWLVTHAHDEKVCGIAPVQAEVQRNAKLLRKGPAWVAHALVDRLVDEYLPVVDRFDDQIEAVEEQVLKGTLRSDRNTIAHILKIKRSLQMLRRTTIYQREILLRLARGEPSQVPRELMPFFRDIYDHFARVTELVDSYRELVTSLLEAHFSMQSNRMNEVMKRLTVISTIMLPLSLIAGIYGMNFKHMPELEWPHGYYYALTLMGVIAIAILTFFRVKKWI